MKRFTNKILTSASVAAPLTPDTILTSAELASVLKTATRTPEAWRTRGDGPRYSRIGGKLGRVVYRWGDVLDYLDRRAFNSTSEETALSDTTLWRMEKRGIIPKPIRLSNGLSMRPEDEIDANIAGLAANRVG